MKRYLIIINGNGKHNFVKLFRKCQDRRAAHNLGNEYAESLGYTTRDYQLVTTTMLKQNISKSTKVIITNK